jgi:hypothetical protein
MIERKLSKILSLAALALAVTLLAACVSDDTSAPAPSAADQPPPAPVYARFSESAPPAPQAETKPVINIRSEVWRPGHWAYDNGQFSWVPGEVMQKPTFTAVWAPDRWEKHTYGWAFICGHWQ